MGGSGLALYNAFSKLGRDRIGLVIVDANSLPTARGNSWIGPGFF